MKTLLLTLVVVTIVCLDLGDSLRCYMGPKTPRTCPPGENLCFTKTWCDPRCSLLGKLVKLGCAATCPIPKSYEDVTCCSTDNCNRFPKWERSRPRPRGLLSSIMDHP
uniref:Alpha-elapitoxin-Al2a n=1 Tax=Austrelaps labialis TaxID=471292 RepID=3L22A_AUSLA|nr:RecName: Full=Alpha-elapitoxin-Al2a; Short=Alpha-EPTX-Al2a; AltName: Full=Putative long neurotoxin; Flags: Precursor [Austrelaps labialis]ABX58152.1 putative long neurotoxin [Austrelaps labialis]